MSKIWKNPRCIRVATLMKSMFNLPVVLDFVKFHNVNVLSMVCMRTKLHAAEIFEEHTVATAF